MREEIGKSKDMRRRRKQERRKEEGYKEKKKEKKRGRRERGEIENWKWKVNVIEIESIRRQEVAEESR